VKKLFILFAFALIISACDKSSNSSTDTSFRIKSGTLTKFASPVTTYNVGGNSGSYAIIYSGTINSISYVGIACSQDPENPSSYHLKIYYQASSILPGTHPATTVINGTPYSESVVITSIDLNTTLTTSKYNVYDIIGNSPNAGALAITAVQAN
jgi:hypothetical protein